MKVKIYSVPTYWQQSSPISDVDNEMHSTVPKSEITPVKLVRQAIKAKVETNVCLGIFTAFTSNRFPIT